MSGESYSRTSLPRATLVALSSSRDFRHRAWLCVSRSAPGTLSFGVLCLICVLLFTTSLKGEGKGGLMVGKSPAAQSSTDCCDGDDLSAGLCVSARRSD